MLKPNYPTLALFCVLAHSLAAAAEMAPAPVSPTRLEFSIGDYVLPSDLTLAHNRIYVVDGGDHRVMVADLDGHHLFAFGKRGSGPGELEGPVGISALADGAIVVCDSGNGRLQIFEPNGKYRSQIALVDGDGAPTRPIDVVLNPARASLYISDGRNHKILGYSVSGEYLFEWGQRGNLPSEFRYPANIVLSRERTLYVVDVMNTRVQRFTEAGSATGAIGEWGVLPGRMFRPKGVALDNAGRVYVTDSYLDVIQVFEDGHFSHVLGDGAGQPRRFESPGGIAIEGDRIYVTEMFGRKVGVYTLL